MKFIETDDIDFWYIDNVKDLKDTVEFLITQDYIGCDTETYIDLNKENASALDAHSALISLIQINTCFNTKPYVIDVIAIGVENCRVLIDNVFMDNNIIKIFHNASFDIKQFKQTFNVWIKNVRCSMTAMKSLGIATGMKASIFRGHSYKDMCRDIFDADIDKTESASQWGARPLKNTQLSYSALDVGAYKDSKHYSYLLEGYFIFDEELTRLNQTISSEADQQAMYISAKLEYQGMYVNTDILDKSIKFAEEKTNINRNKLVEELGFTVYNEIDINEAGELVQVSVIPDLIKKLLNNNKGLVDYINNYLKDTGGAELSSLQAEEVKAYLDNIEKEIEGDNLTFFDEDYLNAKYDSITLIKSLLNYKKYSKLLSECEKYKGIINPNTSRVHAGFNAIGTVTGRMSSSGDVNLQQVSNVSIVLELNKEQL